MLTAAVTEATPPDDAQRREAELRRQRDEAIEASSRKSQFLANVSHEIRTPLNGVLGVTQLLRNMPLPPEAREYLDVLEGSGEALLDIVNDVLDLSKIEANRLELESAVFDLAHLVSTAVRTFAPQVQKKRVALSCEIAPSAVGPTRGDPGRLRQVVNNVVSNAVKFTDVGSVRVDVERLGDLVRVRVIDTGPGIPAARLAVIFEPFEQGDGSTARRYGGTGLGLTISRRLVRLMGGDLVASSSEGVGSTFEATFLAPAVVIDAPVLERKPSAASPRRMRVLLAEDNRTNAVMTTAMVERLGHAIEVVTTGLEAVSRLQREPFDLVLMDVLMPECDGLEATRRIRHWEAPSGKHVPIVALTANAVRGDDLKCLSAGMDAYLAKPVTVEALADMLAWFGASSTSLD
ncbi:MAG: response regulator [Archangium sp.]|nr:response regulator [Archangium sp.]